MPLDFPEYDYSACWQLAAVLSQAAQSSSVQPSTQSAQLPEQPPATSSAGCELLLQAHEAAANIAATIAIDINTFFIIRFILGVNNVRKPQK